MKKGLVLVIFGCVLILLSSLMVIYNHYEDNNSMIESKKIYEIIHNDELNILEDKTNDTYQSKEMKVANIDGYDYIGTILIPTLNLELPVMSDYDNVRLNIKGCEITNNQTCPFGGGKLLIGWIIKNICIKLK